MSLICHKASKISHLALETRHRIYEGDIGGYSARVLGGWSALFVHEDPGESESITSVSVPREVTANVGEGRRW